MLLSLLALGVGLVSCGEEQRLGAPAVRGSLSAELSQSSAPSALESAAAGSPGSAVFSAEPLPPAPTRPPLELWRAAEPRATLPSNPQCPLPQGLPEWSWRRLRRVEGLGEDALVVTLDVGAKLDNLQALLRVLREIDLQTTIFLYTAELESSPQGPALLRQMVQDGHELANHTLSHRDLTKLGAEERRVELERVDAFVQSTVSRGVRPFFREPMLATNDEVDQFLKDQCYRSVWFTVDTGDWHEGVTATRIVDNVMLSRGKPRVFERGSIFIFHGSQQANLVALPDVVSRLRQKGFSFLTLGEALRRAGR